MKSSRYCLKTRIDEFRQSAKELDINIFNEFPGDFYLWIQIEGEKENLDKLFSID